MSSITTKGVKAALMTAAFALLPAAANAADITEPIPDHLDDTFRPRRCHGKIPTGFHNSGFAAWWIACIWDHLFPARQRNPAV